MRRPFDDRSTRTVCSLAAFLALPVVAAAVSRGAADIPLLLVSSSGASELPTLAVTPDGARIRRVFGYAYHPLISPDRRWMLVADGNHRPVLVRTDGTRTLRLPGTLSLVEGAWAPDGRRVAYVDGDDRTRIVDLEGRLLTTSRALSSQPPVWNTNGTLLAGLSARFNKERKHTRDVVVVDAATGTGRAAAADAYPTSRLAWRPGTTTLAYETAEQNVVLLDITNGRRILVKPTATPFHLLWSRDGNLLAIGKLNGGVDIVDPAGVHVRSFATRTSDVEWVDAARLSYMQGAVGLVVSDVRSGQTATVVRQDARRIQAFEWSPDGSAVAVQRERFPGYGSDVFVVDSVGHESRTTSPYPYGGDNTLIGWAAGAQPPELRQPSNVRDVEVTSIARVPLAAWLFQASPTRIYASLTPANDDRTDAIGCGPLFFQRVPRLDVCSGKPLSDAAATATAYAWVVEHPDGGIGDEATECAYILARRVARPPAGGGSCPANRTRHPGFVVSASGGSVDVAAAGETLVVARTFYDSTFGTDTIEGWDGRRMHVLVRGTDKVQVSLVDADAHSVLVRRGRRLEVVTLRGAVRARRPTGRRFVDARLDGGRVVILRGEAVELYSPALRLERRRRLPPAWAEPTLCGARGDVVAYVRGVVPHLLSLRTGRDVALRLRGAAPPVTCGIGGGRLVLAFQREGADPVGFVGSMTLR